MSERIVSDDGYYEWDGGAWVPRPEHLWPTPPVVGALDDEPEPTPTPSVVEQLDVEPVPDWTKETSVSTTADAEPTTSPGADTSTYSPDYVSLADRSELLSASVVASETEPGERSPRTVIAMLAAAAVAGLALVVVGWTMFTAEPAVESSTPQGSGAPTASPAPSSDPVETSTPSTEPTATDLADVDPSASPTPTKPNGSTSAKSKKKPSPSATTAPTKSPDKPGEFTAAGTKPSVDFDMDERLFFNEGWTPAKAEDGTFTITGLAFTDVRTDADRTPVNLEFTVYQGTDVLAEGNCPIPAGDPKKATPVTTCTSKYPFKKTFDYTSFGISW